MNESERKRNVGILDNAVDKTTCNDDETDPNFKESFSLENNKYVIIFQQRNCHCMKLFLFTVF